MIRKAGFTQHRLVFVIEAMRTLLADDNFTNLLRAEGLETLPKLLVERVEGGGIR
jgi:ParB family chromosome partitioning protein